MDEFSLQKTDRFQRQQVVHQEGVGVFQSPDDAPEGGADVGIVGLKSAGPDGGRAFVPVSVNARL